MNELPKDLGGWQHLAPNETMRDGDIFAEEGKPIGFLKGSSWMGQPAKTLEEGCRFRAYRRIAVAKQGDLDHKNFAQKEPMPTLPTTPAERKKIPICTGVLDYFPNAIAAVAECSLAGNRQHHDGTPLHWDKSKSTDEADALVRHLIQRGTRDTDGIRHSAKVAWRSLALLEREIEAERLAP